MANTALLYTSLTVTHATNTHPSIVSVIQRIKTMKSSRICLIGYLGFISKMYSLGSIDTDSLLWTKTILKTKCMPGF